MCVEVHGERGGGGYHSQPLEFYMASDGTGARIGSPSFGQVLRATMGSVAGRGV